MDANTKNSAGINLEKATSTSIFKTMIYEKFVIYKSFASVAKFKYFGTVTHKNHIHDEDARNFEV